MIKTAQNSETGSKYWQGTVNSAATSVELPVMKAEKMDNKWVGIDEYFDGNPGYGSTISNSLGTMFCIWCDASQDSYLTDSDVISENENYGALYQLEKLAEHYWPDDIKKDTTAPVVKVDDGSEVPSKMAENGTLTLTADKSVTWETSDPEVIDLLSPANDTSITGTSVTTASLLSSARAANGTTITGTTVTAVAKKPGTATITVTDEDGNKAQHTIEVTAAAADTEQTVILKVGDSATFDTTANVGDYGIDNGYIATANVTAGKAQAASVEKATSITSGKKYLITTNDKVVSNTTSKGYNNKWGNSTGLLIQSATISSANVDQLLQHAWTITKVGDQYTVQDATGKYLTIGGNNSVTLQESQSLLTIGTNNSYFYFANDDKYYLNNFGGGNVYASAYKENLQSNDYWTLYEITEETTGSNVLTITGTGEGETTANIGGVDYTIKVTAPTIPANQTLNFGGSFDLPTGAVVEDISGDKYVTVADGKVTAGQTAGTATVTAVKKNAGEKVTKRYTYNITVSNVDLSNAPNLPVELWITNRYAGGTHNGTTYPATEAGHIVKISAANAYGENGVTLESLVPTNGADEKNLPTLFWKGTRLDSANKQTHTGTDKTKDGLDFQKVRYYGENWQYYWNGEWTTVEPGDQIIAYYMQVYNTSPEIVTAFRDYAGIAGNGGGEHDANWFDGYMGLGTAVVYPGKTMSPDGDEGIWNKTLLCYYVGSAGGNTPGLIKVFNSDDYRITKITITHGVHKDSTGATGADATKTWNRTTSSVVWEKTTNDAGDEWYNETTIWTANPADTDNSTITLDDSIWGDTWKTSGIGEAFLLLFYVEPVEKEDNLKIVYWDDSNDTLIKDKISVSVKEGTTFLDIRQTSPVNKGVFTLDADAKIKNSVGSMEGINSRKLSLVDGIDERYKSGLYEYVSADISEDGKTLTLHYKAQDPKKFYVIDFGLPLHIKMSDVIKNAGDLSSVAAIGSPTYGNVTYDQTEKAIIYTPTKVLPGAQSLQFRLTFQNNATEKVTIGVIPASNVLYEDNFLTVNTSKGKSYANWTTDPSEITAQQTADPNTLYGYDNAYASSTGNSMESAWTITALKEGEGSKYLTTTFNGTGFDLIGTSGPNTGYVYLVLQGPENRVVVIDTSYGEGTLYQVPLAHLDGLKAGTYTVNIRAAYRAAPVTSTAAGTNSIAAYSLQNAKADALNDVYEEVESMLPAGMDLDDCEFVYADSESPLAELDNSSVAAYALTADEVSTAAATTRTAGTTVTIDGFRVYRDTNNPAYTESEQGVQYVNVMKAKINNDDGSFTAYVEGNKGSQWTQANYEANGGPQNEVYLGKGTDAIAFKVTPGATIQISARAVSGPAQLVVNGTPMQKLTSNTEMYYTVTPKDGVVAIRNDGDNMLALGNLKLPAGTSTQALTAADEEIVLSLLSMDPAPAFAPKLSAAARSFKVIRNKLVTVTVHASTDVARLTINGKTVSPTNGLLVKRGWSKEYIYLFTDTVKRDVSKTYEIVAYNADGTASAPVQVTG